MMKYQYLGLVRFETMRLCLDKHAMPAHRMGCLWKFKKDEVETWVKAGVAAESNDKDSGQ